MHKTIDMFKLIVAIVSLILIEAYSPYYSNFFTKISDWIP